MNKLYFTRIVEKTRGLFTSRERERERRRQRDRDTLSNTRPGRCYTFVGPFFDEWNILRERDTQRERDRDRDGDRETETRCQTQGLAAVTLLSDLSLEGGAF